MKNIGKWLRRSLLVTIAALLSASFIAACGGDSDSGDSGEATASNGDSCADFKTAYVAIARLPIMQSTYEGGLQAAKECGGGQIDYVGPAQADANAQIQAFRDSIASGADGIMAEPLPPDLWTAVIKQATEDGVPVYTDDAPAANLDIAAHIGPDPVELGSEMAKAVADIAGPDAEGEIVIGSCVPGVELVEVRVDGFKEEMSKLLPNVTYTDTLDTTQEPNKSYRAWQQIAQKYPDALAFTDFCEYGGPAMARIQAQSPQDWISAGIGQGPELIKSVAAGNLDVAIGQQPWYRGYVAFRILFDQLMTGEAPLPHQSWLNTGVETVTEENAADVLVREQALADGDVQPQLDHFKKQVDELFADPAAQAVPLADYFTGS